MDQIMNIVFDTNYTAVLPNGGYPVYTLDTTAPKKPG
jgi:hypothetical protein